MIFWELVLRENTSLATLEALAHRLQHLTACFMPTGFEISQTLCFWIKFSEVSVQFYKLELMGSGEVSIPSFLGALVNFC